MEKLKIAIITLGNVEQKINLKKIKNWKSKLFEVNSIQKINHIPDSDVDDGYLDHKYSSAGLNNSVSCPANSDLAVAIMSNRFDDNFYLHRLNDNCVGMSIHGIKEILNSENISVENFIIKQFYELYSLKKLVTNFASDEVYSIVHSATRGCLFDLNGDRFDIIYNTEKPIICDSCKSKFSDKQLEDKTFPTLIKELRRIKKPLISRVESFIRQYPLVSICLSGIFAVALNLIANVIYEYLK